MARIAGRFDHCLAELDQQPPAPKGPPMFVLFDMTNVRALARHESFLALAALAVIQFPNVDTQITRCGDNRNYAWLTAKQMRAIAEAMGGKIPHAVFGGCIDEFRALVEETPWLLLPFTTENLVMQAAQLGPAEDKPYAVTAGHTPERLTAWHCEPQRNTRREDSSQWIHFASGGAATAAPPPPAAVAPAKRSPSARPAPAAPPGGTPAAPKPRAASTGPATRPKAGTSTGKVWDIADELSAKLKDKELRKAVIERCEQEGINASTASVQFGKWKSSQ